MPRIPAARRACRAHPDHDFRPAGQRDNVRRVLENLGARGLLVSDGDFLQRIATSTAQAPAPARAVFIRACDRPAQLERLLKSLADYERRFGTTRRYV